MPSLDLTWVKLTAKVPTWALSCGVTVSVGKLNTIQLGRGSFPFAKLGVVVKLKSQSELEQALAPEVAVKDA